jgi:hypothetical protein
MARAVIVLAVLLVGAMSWTSGELRAQTLRERCADAAPGSVTYCEALADAAVTLPARLAIGAVGGNPVAGTASTLGMRVPGSPRWSIALRSTIARASLPPIEGERAMTPRVWSVNADASVGLFNGFNLAPTIGGFGSIDVLGSVGLLAVPEDDGFERSSPLTWALGTRVGILRESFTAPGVSVSAMYRALPDVEFGEPTSGPYFENAGQSVLSLRGTVGKRLLGIGLTGGIGYDRVRSDVRTEFDVPATVFPNRMSTQERGLTFGRTSFLGNVSYTLLILNMAAELGWQEAGERPAGAHRDTGKGGLFGGLAVRLAI